MDPQDDPEARIRALEQPLSDAARASELGTSPYTGSTYPPPSPPPLPSGSYPYGPSGYGPAYQGPPTPNKGRGGQYLLAMIAVLVVAAAAGFAVFMFTSGSSSTNTPGSPRTSPGPGATFTAKPTLPDNGGPIATLVPVTPTVPAGERLSVSGVGEDKTIGCNESIVSISGVSNTVKITGHCASVTVSGIKNHVTVDAAETISASGIENHVRYHFGTPQIDNSGGSNNTVDQG